MEGMWTRFFPAITDLKKKIYEEKVLGEIFRMFADLSYNANIKQVPKLLDLEILILLLVRCWILVFIQLLIQEYYWMTN